MWKYAVLNKNICHFWDRDRACFPEKNPEHRNIYKLIQCCALDFFPQNTLGDNPAFWIFFQDSRIRVNAIKNIFFSFIFFLKLPGRNTLKKSLFSVYLRNILRKFEMQQSRIVGLKTIKRIIFLMR